MGKLILRIRSTNELGIREGYIIKNEFGQTKYLYRINLLNDDYFPSGYIKLVPPEDLEKVS
ncbi:MAG: hypothetical protein HC764_25845 [Pleurocapsa sp. CRU_1_2]|nr:hypothetical protein [Pleurocapsa sp. CRU_1_2]